MEGCAPSPVGGYVLAGGKSSRMGRDKARLELAGRPLVWHAVTKLRQVCMDVCLLSDRQELAGFAPLVRDVHPGCGPIGGMEAALLHSSHDWNLFLPVDMPFVPAALLGEWLGETMADEGRGLRLAMFTAEGVPQPTLCLMHKELLPFLAEAIGRGEYKLFPVLEAAGAELARRRGIPFVGVFRNSPWSADATLPISSTSDLASGSIAESQQKARHLWFVNLNTPEEFAEAERNLASLDRWRTPS